MVGSSLSAKAMQSQERTSALFSHSMVHSILRATRCRKKSTIFTHMLPPPPQVEHGCADVRAGCKDDNTTNGLASKHVLIAHRSHVAVMAPEVLAARLPQSAHSALSLRPSLARGFPSSGLHPRAQASACFYMLAQRTLVKATRTRQSLHNAGTSVGVCTRMVRRGARTQPSSP